ncbi:unnamed protein product, partial [Meganyctiphanes norvegica]
MLPKRMPSPDNEKNILREFPENDNNILNVKLMSADAGLPSVKVVAPRVSKWNNSFEDLLADPAGLHSFAEFLRQEYSHENIYFWTACERYKRAENAIIRKSLAREIHSRHMAEEAPLPVNVDAAAQKFVTNSLDSPDEKIFIEPQEQVFKLMKYDSYSRFIKSSLFKVCEVRDHRNQPMPYPGDHTMDLNLRTDKALMSPESHRRRSTSFTEGVLHIPDKIAEFKRQKDTRRSMQDPSRNTNSLSPRLVRKGGPRIPNNEGNNKMYEYLKITDKQLDDQRGTAINFEMPEFLKNNNTKSAPKDDTTTKNLIK